jgi:hypothetical protein
MPFLKNMAQLYPDYYFCGIKVTKAGLPMADNFLRGMPRYSEIMQLYQKFQDSVTIGGIVAMFGLVEGASDSLSMNFNKNVMIMVKQLREDMAAPGLPLIMGRYEYNADTTVFTPYYKFKQRMISETEKLPLADSIYNRIMLTPYEYVPKADYFDSHHYDEGGYAMWSGAAAEILYNSNWNSWSSVHNPPLKMLFPRGQETFPCTTRIPVTWMCDPESLSVVMIQLSQDSGKSWTVISGDKAFQPEIKTFYWTPSKSGLTFTNSKSLMIKIDDYNGIYSCKSGIFSIDTSLATSVSLFPLSNRDSRLMLYSKGKNIHGVIEPDEYGKVVSVYSLKGVVVFRMALEKNISSFAVPVSHLANGHYFIVIKSKDPSRLESRSRCTVMK